MTRQSRPVPVERRRIAPRPVCVVVVPGPVHVPPSAILLPIAAEVANTLRVSPRFPREWFD